MTATLTVWVVDAGGEVQGPGGRGVVAAGDGRCRRRSRRRRSRAGRRAAERLTVKTAFTVPASPSVTVTSLMESAGGGVVVDGSCRWRWRRRWSRRPGW